ncbi:MAG: histone deacetylase [Rhodopirellula sp.]|nr:histone deacetylase [Rhodopirellula sp.]OUX50725.1 MAG: histone deacetylase [Rhodopirellula sp. TMED283]
MKIYYTDHFNLPLPDSHRFPMVKYRQLRQHVVRSPFHLHDLLIVPPAATDEQLLSCHTERYVSAVRDGTLSNSEIRRIGFPWSTQMVERSRRSTGATLAASRAALSDGIAVNLAGGTHHAMHDAGEGYCVFNDAAVTIRTLQREKLIQHACVIDLDVHQGNGTAEILGDDHTAFTLSLHGVKNFPMRKSPSDLDIDLDDGTTDEQYMAALDGALDQLDNEQPFDLAIFLAGADPYKDDRLGRLDLSKNGLAERDRTVMQWCRDRSIPLAIAMAGGYAPDVNDIVSIHGMTVQLASLHSRIATQ